jgi:hypothetical protein
MKTISMVLISIGLWLMTGCAGEGITRVGFSSDIETYSNGLTMIKVSGDAGSLYLSGSVNVTSGTVIVELTDPSGQPCVADTLVAGEAKAYSRHFRPVEGHWKLHYRSLDGTGKIYLHLSTE